LIEVEVRDLVKKYDEPIAVEGISFTIETDLRHFRSSVRHLRLHTVRKVKPG